MRFWSEDEHTALYIGYQELPINVLTATLHRSNWSIYLKARELGLTDGRPTAHFTAGKSPDIYALCRRRKAERESKPSSP